MGKIWDIDRGLFMLYFKQVIDEKKQCAKVMVISTYPWGRASLWD